MYPWILKFECFSFFFSEETRIIRRKCTLVDFSPRRFSPSSLLLFLGLLSFDLFISPRYGIHKRNMICFHKSGSARLSEPTSLTRSILPFTLAVTLSVCSHIALLARFSVGLTVYQSLYLFVCLSACL